IVAAAENGDEVLQVASFAAWNHAVGEGLRKNAVPVKLEGDRLLVAVPDAIWQKQLQPLVNQLIFKLNSALGRPLIRAIDLKLEPQSFASRATSDAAGISKTQAFITPELLSAAARISDPALRRVFIGAAENCLHRLEQAKE
ncbi:MAG TPA: DUF721 domain-containing protein, partial [Pyrinomonadaceae bacterium]|nr:DUF721 domain-containing protein [Pyrinomonadaceae bacterium]